MDSQTGQGGLVLTNNYFNYESTILKLINTDTLYGVSTLNFDLVKNIGPAFRIYSPNKSIAINTNANSGTVTNSLYFSDSGGNIGFGTFSPSRTLHVAGDLLSNALFCGDNGNAGDSQMNVFDSSSSVSMRYGNALSVNNCMTMTWTKVGLGSASNYLTFNPYGYSNALVVCCNGTVGIGTSSPAAPLHVNASASITIDPSSTQYGQFSKTTTVYSQLATCIPINFNQNWWWHLRSIWFHI